MKQALIEENKTLADEGGLIIDGDVEVFDLDLGAILQKIVQESESSLSAIELTVLYTARFVQPGNIGGYCSFITANEIASLSFESWLVEQRGRFPQKGSVA